MPVSPELAADIEAAFPEIRKEWLVWPNRFSVEIERIFPEVRRDGAKKPLANESELFMSSFFTRKSTGFDWSKKLQSAGVVE